MPPGLIASRLLDTTTVALLSSTDDEPRRTAKSRGHSLEGARGRAGGRATLRARAGVPVSLTGPQPSTPPSRRRHPPGAPPAPDCESQTSPLVGHLCVRMTARSLGYSSLPASPSPFTGS